MKVNVDMSKVVPAESIKGGDGDETKGLHEFLQEAQAYISSFSWVAGVKRAYFGLGIAKIVGVFLFEITPSRDDVDEKIWVIVGDLPPAYITVEDAPNPATALDEYIGAMQSWVEAAKAGQPIDGLIPVNVPPSPENGARLESRLQFLDTEILSGYAADLAD